MITPFLATPGGHPARWHGASLKAYGTTIGGRPSTCSCLLRAANQLQVAVRS